jgi:hypothetical protein
MCGQQRGKARVREWKQGVSKEHAISYSIYIKENSQKSSWSNDGVTQFNELMDEVELDRNSAEGKQFEIEFQTEMAGSSGNRGKKRKASRRWCSLGMT